jgi:carbamoyltransferase
LPLRLSILKKIPSVVHVDETCRVQTVCKDTNPKFHKLLTEFEKITGIPIVLNTSFNVQAPIVCTLEDAVLTFLKTKVDYLVIDNFLIWNNISQIHEAE